MISKIAGTGWDLASIGLQIFAERRTPPQKLQCHLGIGSFAQRLENPESLGGRSLGVVIAECGDDGPPKQLEVAIPDDFEVSRETGHIDCGGRAGGEDELTFVLAELPAIGANQTSTKGETDVLTAGLKRVQGSFES